MTYFHKQHIGLIALPILIFAIVGCDFMDHEIEYKTKGAKPFLVMFSYLCPDSLLSVKVDVARLVMENPAQEELSDCTVKVFENDVLYEQLSYKGNSIYKGQKRPAIGKTYRVTVESAGFVPIEATSETIKRPVIGNAIYHVQERMGNYALELMLNDPPGEMNYYRLLLFRTFVFDTIPDYLTEPGRYDYEYFHSLLKGNELIVQEYITSKQALFNGLDEGDITDSREGDFTNKVMIFKDELFNGKNYMLNFEFSYNGGYVTSKRSYFTYSLQHISREYYLFLKTNIKFQITQADPFVEPVQVFTNVKNGAGILASYSSTEINKEIENE